MRTAKAPTKAAPDAVSATVKRAPACWEPTWLLCSALRGRTTVASPALTSVISSPRWAAKGTAIDRPLAIASKSTFGIPGTPGIGAAYLQQVRRSRRIATPSAGSGSAALEGRVPGAAVLEEGADGVLQVLGREQLRGFGPHSLVSGGHPALAEAAEDVLRHRVRLGRPPASSPASLRAAASKS